MNEVSDKAKVSVGPQELSIEGSEAFVEMLVEQLGVVELLKDGQFFTAKRGASAAPADGGDEKEDKLLPPPNERGEISKYDEVYAETADGFSIIADVEEGTIANTARNIILLYLFGKELSGSSDVTDDDLRAVCEYHACYDPGNFSYHVKGMGSKVVRSGTSRSYTLKLTAPGKRAAKLFVTELQKKATGQ